MEALGLNLGYLLVQIGSFLIVLLVLHAWVYKPLIAMLEKRRTDIAQGLEDARIAAEAREHAEQEAEKVLADARAKAATAAAEIATRAEEQSHQIIAEAEQHATKIRETARMEAEQERNRVLGEVRGQIASLAMAATQKLIGEALDEKRQRTLIDQFFSGVKAGKVAVLEGVHVSGENAVVTSAVPLTDQEQETVKTDVVSKLGKDAQVSFKVDPRILGGLRVQVGGKVLDGSVSGNLESMRQNLN
ncbi:MAG: F0F1 ATP synthase subunit B [Anaerolineales bacterium]|nr:F0F1 ATP synthase subunit B [Anaerolineales bacterium]